MNEEDPQIEWFKKAHKAKKRKLLGDKVEEILAPFVQAVDVTLGTNIKGCGACQKRKELLNQIDKTITGQEE